MKHRIRRKVAFRVFFKSSAFQFHHSHMPLDAAPRKWNQRLKSLIGLAIAFGVAQLLSSIFYGVSAADLLTFGGIGALMCIITFVARYIPARRAMQVDPMIALRYE
jgi:hypothetical protein